MSHAIQYAINWVNFTSPFDKLVELKNEIKKRRDIRHTYNELNKLSDRELKDIGLHRGDIYAVAHESFSNRYDFIARGNK